MNEDEGKRGMGDIKKAVSLLQESDRAVLDEFDELTLDFTSLNRETMRIISAKCVVIGYGHLCDEFLALCVDKEHSIKLEVVHLVPQDFLRLTGYLGSFELYFRNAEGRTEKIQTSQVVSFASLEHLPAHKGVHFANTYAGSHEMLQAVLDLCGERLVRRNIVFNASACQYNARRALPDGSGFCHKCVDICPTLGVSKDDSTMLLQLSDVDCIACGRCVSVCPTGSVQREGDGLEAFTYKARLYRGRIPLVVSQEEFESPEFAQFLEEALVHNPLLLPFVMAVPDMLNETYLLILLQESASPVVVYSSLGEHTQECIESLNDIYGRIFNARAIIQKNIATPELQDIKIFENSHYIYTPSEQETSKDIFSERMRFWIKGYSYGKVGLRGFGVINIDSEKCTLCLSCVEACNTNALINNQVQFELLLKPSLCTACGYCISSCAENVLSLESNAFLLEPRSFEYVPIASDKAFECVECGKVFATNKSIQKIRDVLAPVFQGDALKLKSLECCADCKVKIMFQGAK